MVVGETIAGTPEAAQEKRSQENVPLLLCADSNIKCMSICSSAGQGASLLSFTGHLLDFRDRQISVLAGTLLRQGSDPEATATISWRDPQL